MPRRYREAIRRKKVVIRKANNKSKEVFINKYNLTTHYFKRTCNIGNLVNFSVLGNATRGTNALTIYNSGIGAIEYASYSCYGTIDALPNYTEFTSLFDRYKITKMELRFIQYATSAATGAAVGASYGQAGVIWHGVHDSDDSSVPAASDAGLQTLREYQFYRTRNVFDPRRGLTITQKCKPRLPLAAYGAGVFSRYASAPPMWIDAASTDVQHFGFKGIFEISPTNNGATPNSIFMKPELTLYFQCKDLR